VNVKQRRLVIIILFLFGVVFSVALTIAVSISLCQFSKKIDDGVPSEIYRPSSVELLKGYLRVAVFGSTTLYKVTWIDENGTKRTDTICWDDAYKEAFICSTVWYYSG